ncbi:MAG: ABC transporter ATP-binding protein [Verrucomicrobiota bacterium]
MLKVSHLNKRFGRRDQPAALSDLSFTVEKGEIFGLLGHNGAGKSTALGIMLGMVYPDSGEVSIGGVSVQSRRELAMSKTGAIFESPNFYDYLSGWRNLQVLTAFSGGVTKKEMEEMVEWVGLKERIQDKVRTYSHGMRQRLALAQALLPRPEMLLLDEPTDGLDPDGIVEFRKQLFSLRDDFGVTILLNSHLLSEVEKTCDRIVILRKGCKVYEGSCQGLEQETLNYRIEVDQWQALQRVAGQLGGQLQAVEGLLQWPRGKDIALLVSALVEEGVKVRQVTYLQPSLEDLYMKVRQKQGEESG